MHFHEDIVLREPLDPRPAAGFARGRPLRGYPTCILPDHMRKAARGSSKETHVHVHSTCVPAHVSTGLQRVCPHTDWGEGGGPGLRRRAQRSDREGGEGLEEEVEEEEAREVGPARLPRRDHRHLAAGGNLT